MRRERQARWDAGNMRTVSTKLTRAEFQAFWTECVMQGVKPYTLVQRMLRAWMRDRA